MLWIHVYDWGHVLMIQRAANGQCLVVETTSVDYLPPNCRLWLVPWNPRSCRRLTMLFPMKWILYIDGARSFWFPSITATTIYSLLGLYLLTKALMSIYSYRVGSRRLCHRGRWHRTLNRPWTSLSQWYNGALFKTTLSDKAFTKTLSQLENNFDSC